MTGELISPIIFGDKLFYLRKKQSRKLYRKTVGEIVRVSRRSRRDSERQSIVKFDTRYKEPPFSQLVSSWVTFPRPSAHFLFHLSLWWYVRGLFVPHDLQIRDVHLPREATYTALVAPCTKGASMAEAACPVLTSVAVIAW